MGQHVMKFPFEASIEEIQANFDDYVNSVFSSLGSEFMVIPKGPGFVEYPVFEAGYESLKRSTSGFSTVNATTLMAAARETPISLIVIRTILGFTPPEWA